jgi:flagellar hook-associated protein 1 FlgK
MSGLLNIASRALTANQTVLQTVGHNIANVNTVGLFAPERRFANQ